RPLDGANTAYTVKTNNYAVTGRFWNAHGAASLIRHGKVDRFVSENQPRIRKLDVPLSLVNRHPCSYTVLVNFMLRSPTPPEFVGFVSEYAETKADRIDPAFQWARPALEAAKDIFAQASRP